MKIWTTNGRRQACARIWICVLLLCGLFCRSSCASHDTCADASRSRRTEKARRPSPAGHGDVADAGAGSRERSALCGARSVAQIVRLMQKNKSFEPHILVVPAGSSVEFPNRDPFFHNVFSLFEGKRFDLGLYEAGTSRGWCDLTGPGSATFSAISIRR